MLKSKHDVGAATVKGGTFKYFSWWDVSYEETSIESAVVLYVSHHWGSIMRDDILATFCFA